MAKTGVATARAFRSSVGVPESNRQALTTLLNLRLADTTDLHSQVKWAHWNVKGKDFYQLHLLFDSIAEHLENHIDTIAERITALGGVANGTVREAAAKSTIKEADPCHRRPGDAEVSGTQLCVCNQRDEGIGEGVG